MNYFTHPTSALNLFPNVMSERLILYKINVHIWHSKNTLIHSIFLLELLFPAFIYFVFPFLLIYNSFIHINKIDPFFVMHNKKNYWFLIWLIYFF